MSRQEIIGAIAVIIGIVSYIPYFRDMIKGKTKPHAFTRFIRALMTGIAFAAQVADNGGAGARAMGLTALAAIIICGFALAYGERSFDKTDYFFLGISLISIALRYVTNTPLWSVIIITLADIFAFLPTFRKSQKEPNSETLITYKLSFLKIVLSIIALENFTLITTLYPLSLVIMNGAFVVMVNHWKKMARGSST